LGRFKRTTDHLLTIINIMEGRNLIGNAYSDPVLKGFSAIDPSSEKELEGEFYPATEEDVDHALELATKAFQIYKKTDKDRKAAFLRAIATEILALGVELIERASAESGLPMGRIQGERGRTVDQLNLFATLVEEGSWVEAIIDSELPERVPAPRPDIRRMLVPIGPVVVFGASNFPLAFSVAGGDTASALASGCPVVVKAHQAHPGTSALVASAIRKAVIATDMPEGVFSMLHDSGFKTGELLVKHTKTYAVTFTGSFKGGMALTKYASERARPIPVFAEMGSINPVLLLPGALNARAEKIAAQYATSITLGAGQFCTNPGLLLGIDSPGLTLFKEVLGRAITAASSATMLTPAICKNYKERALEMLAEKGVAALARSTEENIEASNQAVALIAEVSAEAFLSNPKLKEEVFGPWSLLVVAKDETELAQLLDYIDGQLTLSVMAEDADLELYAPILERAEDISGRILLNGVPTGVEVCGAMQHGGPFPATSDSRFTSVGTTAIRRFVRPLSWQNWNDALLPPALQKGNPLNIWRLVDSTFTK
jgi:alpha-ketoglutaric semialdehyde dehydrogenase